MQHYYAHKIKKDELLKLVSKPGEISIMHVDENRFPPHRLPIVKQITGVPIRLINTFFLGCSPIERIGELLQRLRYEKLNDTKGFIVIDHLDNLLNDPFDGEETTALWELLLLIASEMKAHVVVLHRYTLNKIKI
ncbi:MAG: hypothetical protein JST75_14920 [Bacteroidetes bacterium]|nr:hypothetical protein [Bacteroidota bacterium]